MLKIKDNVDLKELEKYGFKLNKKRIFGAIDAYEKNYIAVLTNDNDNKYGTFHKNELISLSWDFDDELLELMYDLIKADLVEKVDE